MTSQEMMKATAKPGNAWVNVAPLGEKPDWREVKSPFGPHSDPNYGVGLPNCAAVLRLWPSSEGGGVWSLSDDDSHPEQGRYVRL